MGDIERLVAAADDGTVDDEFLQHLSKGGELLAAGKADEAKDVLEKAFALQPKNPKAQNLLGLTYFKLGVFDRAAEIYELLVRDNPVDPTLRVNLGLVYLKVNALERATREFETAVDLAPDHKKAQNYLGLAYAQVGDYARAKNCFVAAGSLTMAEKMERALKDPSKAPRMPVEGEKPVAEPPAVPPPPPPPAAGSLADKMRRGKSSKAAPPDIEVDIDVDPATEPEPEPVNAWEAQPEPAVQPAEAELAPAPAVETEVTIEPEPEPVAVAPIPAPAPAPVEAPAAPSWQPATSDEAPGQNSLGELSPRLAVAPRELAAAFDIGDLVHVRVAGEILARLDGLVAALGGLSYVPEMKRFRGRATDKAFGDGERRMMRVSGNGELVLDLKGRTFVVVELMDESAYFREDTVFGFEETVVFENGRVPSKVASDLHLVHLRGRGQVLLSVPAPVRTVGIAGAPCSVPMQVLVGWHGSLTPRVCGIPDEQTGTPVVPVVELTGEGWAIVTGFKAPAAPPATAAPAAS